MNYCIKYTNKFRYFDNDNVEIEIMYTSDNRLLDFCNAPLLAVFATESQFSEVYPGKEELYKAATFTNIFGKEEKVLRKTFRD